MTVCYLCGSTSNHKRPGGVRDNADLEILECSNCGLVFLSTFDHIQPMHYEESGMHGDQPVPVQNWLRETDADDERRFRHLQSRLPGKSILDFGCGAGGFLLKARQIANVTEGVEPEQQLQAHFSQSGLKVWAGIEALHASGSQYDLITAFHVIEHLMDPREALTQLASMLKKGGELIVEVPSANDALLTLYSCDAFRHFTYWSQHLYLFNSRTLSDLANQAGLSLRWIKQVQRYPLSNHLHWLAKGKAGGHQAWSFLDSPSLNEAYASQLAALGLCDTLLAGIGHD